MAYKDLWNGVKGGLTCFIQEKKDEGIICLEDAGYIAGMEHVLMVMEMFENIDKIKENSDLGALQVQILIDIFGEDMVKKMEGVN